MSPMITEELVRLDADLGSEKHDVIRALARVVDEAGRATDADQLAEDALAREATAATGLNGGIAIPHCRSVGVEVPTLAFARLSPAVEFGAKDGPADLAFLIAAPAGGDASHLKLLAKLARALVKSEFTDSLRAATTPAQIVALVGDVVGEEPAPAAGRRRCGCRGSRCRDATGRDRRSPFAGGRDGVPDRDRPHLHGRRGARGGRRARRRRHPGRDAGLGRLQAAAPATPSPRPTP